MVQDVFPQDFFAANWVSLPVANGQQLIVLAGVARIRADGFRGLDSGDWNRDTFRLLIDITDPIRVSGKTPTRPRGKLLFRVNQFAPFATVSSLFDRGEAIDLGAAVDLFSPVLDTVTDVNGTQVDRIFSAIDVDLAVRDRDAFIFRVAYQVTLLGEVVEVVLPSPI